MIYLTTGILIFSFMCLVFLLSIIRKDNSIVDTFWGLGFICITLYAFFFWNESHDNTRQVLVLIMIIIWGMRLAGHIFLRNRGKAEDFRYLNWRNTWRYFYLRSFLQIYMLQGAFMFILAIPLMFIYDHSATPLGWWDLIGMLAFTKGLLFEAIGDHQLTRFKKKTENKGKIITTGLWRYSRHPNYFGESLVWFGFSFMALSIPGGWITLISPLVITLLLRFVSGVPMLEKKYANHPEFQEYKAKTSAFIPWLPKK